MSLVDVSRDYATHIQKVDNSQYKDFYMGVSENRGTPKSPILIGFSIISHPFLGTTIHYFRKHPYEPNVEYKFTEDPPPVFLFYLYSPPNALHRTAVLVDNQAQWWHFFFFWVGRVGGLET